MIQRDDLIDHASFLKLPQLFGSPRHYSSSLELLDSGNFQDRRGAWFSANDSNSRISTSRPMMALMLNLLTDSPSNDPTTISDIMRNPSTFCLSNPDSISSALSLALVNGNCLLPLSTILNGIPESCAAWRKKKSQARSNTAIFAAICIA
nr:hypothetical protein Iba_chr07fCG0370 [Ipomoea batatas]